ncbi:SCO family protein [Salicibibacter halophilus]|uniref:SCO family protein n=1 Tax=Salicibibacter halophilus TaxID=2502791 RepID=A0A514LGH4_9BACI|nr:SCO family protein [Salicibibacter halophilus]QDI90953.1 SCO family protein [Salicibibacter halophilus]
MIKKTAVAFGTLLLFCSGCAWLYETGAENGTDLSESELYVDDFSFTNQDEETVTNEDLEGDYWVASMVFSRCPTVCNVMTPNMSSLQADLEDEDLDTTLVSFTVDPDFDNPDTLRSYGENYNADFAGWHFLTGYEQEDIEAIAQNSFASVVENDPDGNDIIHSTQFYLVDPNGQVIRQYDGMETDTEPIAEDIQAVQG